MLWYSDGSIQVAANGQMAAGTGTAFLRNVRVGDGLTIAGSTSLHEVTNIASDTQLTFAPPYTGAAGAGKAYRIAPIQGYVKEAADLLRQFTQQFGTIASNQNLSALAVAVGGANKGLMFTAPGVIGTFDLTAQARTFLAAASLAQQRSALGLVPQSASADASEGALLVQRGNGGSWGLGSSAATDSSAANTDIRTYANTRFFANGGQHNPALENKTELQFSSGLFISGGPSIQSSMVIGYGAAARMGFLSKLNGSTWNPVRVLWDDNSLVLTNSPLDFTVGRSTIVGFAGWGASAPSIDPSTTGVTDQQSSLLYSIAGNGSPFPTSTPIINVRGTRSMAWAARGSRCWAYTYGEAPVLMEHWTDKNLNLSNLPDLTINGSVLPLAINSTRPIQLSLNRLNSTGNISIGFSTSSFSRYLGFAPDASLRVGVTEDLTQAASVWTTANLTPNKLEERTRATLGSVSAQKGQMYLCTDTVGRGARPVYSTGTTWVRIEDDSIVTSA